MRRLAKNKRKTSESNSEVRQENGDTTDRTTPNESLRASKGRKSKIQAEPESSNSSSKRLKRDAVDDDTESKEAGMVVDSRIYRKKRQYKVHWRNFSDQEDTWESPENIDPELIEAYNKREKSKDNAGAEEEGRKKPLKAVAKEDDDAEYEVESILAVRTFKNKRRYKVHWKGTPDDQDTWVSENKLSCPEILQDFLRKQKEKKNLPKPINVDDDSEEYEVERVVEVRFKKGGAREFLIRWKGFSAKDDTWEPEEHLNCPDLISKFMERVEKAKSTTSRELRANPVMTERLTLNMKSANLRYSRRPQTQNRPTYHNYLM